MFVAFKIFQDDVWGNLHSIICKSVLQKFSTAKARFTKFTINHRLFSAKLSKKILQRISVCIGEVVHGGLAWF